MENNTHTIGTKIAYRGNPILEMSWYYDHQQEIPPTFVEAMGGVLKAAYLEAAQNGYFTPDGLVKLTDMATDVATHTSANALEHLAQDGMVGRTTDVAADELRNIKKLSDFKENFLGSTAYVLFTGPRIVGKLLLGVNEQD